MQFIHTCYLTGILLSVGCASTTQPSYQGADSITQAARTAILNGHADQVICWREMPNGSHLYHKYCATKQEVAENKKKQQENIFNAQNGPGPKACSPNC